MSPFPRPSPVFPLSSLLVLAGLAGPVPAVIRDEGNRLEANRVGQGLLISEKTYADPFNEVTLDVIVTQPDGQRLRLPAFWSGGSRWRFRYSSHKLGDHLWKTECSDQANPQLHGVTGRWTIVPYRGENPLYRHGPLRVASDRRHLEHADGTPFFWLGDTWWMGLCQRFHWPEDFQTLARDRHQKGFNVIQIVAGLYPDQGAFDPRAANEAGFPWEKDYRRIRPEYFDAADRRIAYLADAGFVPCIVGAWGYHLPWLGMDKMKQHLRYVVARWGAWPVVWCVAGEFNLPYYLTPGFPYKGEKQAVQWEELTRYFRSINALGRLVTIHPTGIPPMSARGVFQDPSLLDFDMLQTPHGMREALGPTVQTIRASYAARPLMPVINGEASYEALFDRTPAEIARLMFWVCMMSGAAGHTYGANGIWQVNRQGQPYGASPHGGNYGTIPWDKAMNLAGSKQIGLAKSLLQKYAWPRLQPDPRWARWVQKTGPNKAANTKEYEGPYAAWIPGQACLVYVPRPEPIWFYPQNSKERFGRFHTFDPVNGKALIGFKPDKQGERPVFLCQPPVGHDHDWVLLYEE